MAKQKNKDFIKPTTTKEIKSPLAIEKQFEKELVKFSQKVNNSVKFWSIANFNKNFNKNTAKQLSIEFNKLLEYWESEAKEFGKIQSKKFASFIKKYVNSKFLAENANFNKRGLSKAEKNQLTAIYERNLSLIKTIPSHTIESYRETMLKQVDNFDREALEKQAKTIAKISKRRAKLIARDQTQKAVSGYQRARAEALGFEYYVWQTSQDERVSTGKGGHRQLNGRIFKYSEPTAIIDAYGNKGNVSDRVNCLPTGQGIDFTNRPLKLFRSVGSFNEASVIEISTSAGRFIVTSDHKMLTSNGWVCADSLNKGDYILKAVNQSPLAFHINFNQNSVIVSDLFNFIFESLQIAGSFRECLTFFRVGAAGNFNENIRVNEKVYIIDIECFLRDCVNIVFSERFMQNYLPDSTMRIFFNRFISGLFSAFGGINGGFNTPFATPNFIVSCLCYFSDIIGGGIFKANDIRLTSVADFITHILQSFNNASPSNIQDFGHFKDAITRDIAIFNFLCAYVFIIFWNLFNRFKLDNSSIKLKHRKTKKIKIIDIKRLKMDTHIYSLECECGYYTIKNTINKNCRCVALSLYLNQDEDLKLVKDSENGDYYKIVKKVL